MPQTIDNNNGRERRQVNKYSD